LNSEKKGRPKGSMRKPAGKRGKKRIYKDFFTGPSQKRENLGTRQR